MPAMFSDRKTSVVPDHMAPGPYGFAVPNHMVIVGLDRLPSVVHTVRLVPSRLVCLQWSRAA